MSFSAPAKQADQGNRRRCLTAGFTLIELIGVLSIVAIGVAVIAPTITKRIDQAARDAEYTSLNTLSDAFVRSSLTNRQFPVVANPASLPPILARHLDTHTNEVRMNKRRLNRAFLSHPNLNINGGNLPYVQNASGSTNRSMNGQAMIISSIGKALPTINSSDFANIWATPKNTVPSSMSGWGGQGEDLVIERIELAPLFHKVVLMNVDATPNIGRYAVDDTRTNWVNTMPSVAPQTNAWAYYMEGTTINFYRPDGALASVESVREDVSFVYQNNRWGRNLGGDDDVISDFGQLVDRFLQQPVPCEAETGATQRSVVNAFYDYLWGYSDWGLWRPERTSAGSPFCGRWSPKYTSVPVV